MKKLILFLIVSIMLVGLVFAGISLTTNNKLTISNERETFLKSKMNNLSIIEYECEGDQRCFKLIGDLDEHLVNIPTKVCDKPIYRTTYDKYGRVLKKIRTSECTYKIITDEEVLIILKKNLDSKVDKMIEKESTKPKSTIKYNPITILEKK